MKSRSISSLVGIGLISLALFSRAYADESLTRMQQLPLAPDFTLGNMYGEMFSLSQFRGKPVIINFWATWCPPCREELPSMNRAWAKIRDQGIVMIAVNVGENEDTIFRFTGDYPIDFLLLLDRTGDTINRWPIRGLPTTFVVDPSGRLHYRAIGGRQWDSEQLLEQVRALRKITSTH